MTKVRRLLFYIVAFFASTKHSGAWAAIGTGAIGVVAVRQIDDPWVWGVSVFGVVVAYLFLEETSKKKSIATGMTGVGAGVLAGPWLTELMITEGPELLQRHPIPTLLVVAIISATWSFVVFGLIAPALKISIPAAIKEGIAKWVNSWSQK